MRNNRLQRLFVGVVLGLSVAIIVIIISEIIFPGIFENFEAKTVDLRFQTKIKLLEHARQSEKIDDIVIIDIDNRSLNQFGRYQQWPRDHYTEIINYLIESGALIVGFDILFMEPDIDRMADTLLVRATRTAGNVCHSFSFSSAEPDAFLYKMEAPPAQLDALKFSYRFSKEITHAFPEQDRFDGKFFSLYHAARKIGFANFQPDNDSVIRKIPLFMNFAGELYPSLALAMALFLFDVQNSEIHIEPGKNIRLDVDSEDGVKPLVIPVDGQGQMLINYLGTYQTFRYISFYDVWARRVPPEFFAGKIVLVGASVAGLYDLRPVPFQNAFPGVEIHATILHNILTQNFITTNSKLMSWLILVALCLLVSVIAPFFRLRITIPLLFGIASGFVYLTFYLFNHQNFWVEIVRPIISIAFSYVAMISYHLIHANKDRKKIKTMFQHYISATVVNELLKNPDMLKLGGERRIATAFFSDIKNFTTVSENLEPEKLVSVLNEYLSAMTDIVLRYEGYLDKYEGDAIVAIFGVPVEQQNHAVLACNTALDMLKELAILRAMWKRENKPAFYVRIGINSGPMIAGNIGGKNRFDYTVIGDSVNLASRLEGANKMYGTSIIISEDSFNQVHDKFWCRELDLIRVKGKNKPVRIYELIGKKTEEMIPVRSSALEYFLRGLEIYRQRDWIQAFNMFQKALSLYPEDGPSQEFIRRCKHFIEFPRPVDWDGIFELREK